MLQYSTATCQYMCVQPYMLNHTYHAYSIANTIMNNTLTYIAASKALVQILHVSRAVEQVAAGRLICFTWCTGILYQVTHDMEALYCIWLPVIRRDNEHSHTPCSPKIWWTDGGLPCVPYLSPKSFSNLWRMQFSFNSLQQSQEDNSSMTWTESSCLSLHDSKALVFPSWQRMPTTITVHAPQWWPLLWTLSVISSMTIPSTPGWNRGTVNPVSTPATALKS